MSENLAAILDYIIDNFIYGSKVYNNEIVCLFQKYPVNINEKEIVYKELDGMNIKVIQTKHSFVHKLEGLFKLFNSNREINESVLNKWYKSEIIADKMQIQIRKYLDAKGYLIISDRPKKIDRNDFDFLDDLESDDLDDILDDDEFKKEVSDLLDVVSKSNNINYLIEYHSNNEDLSKRSVALDKLVQANSKLVWKIALGYKRLSTTTFDLEDMYQAGMQGLIKAVGKFDVSLGYQFSTYATWWIRQSITRSIADYSTTIRVPVHMREKITKFIKVENEYWNNNGYIATDEEVAELMELTVKGVDELKKYKEFSNLTSIETTIGNDESSTLSDFIPDENNQSPEEYVEERELEKEIHNLFNERLTNREALILTLRFGLENEKVRTLEEIGQIMGVTRERIRQIEAKAIRKLQYKNGLERLGDFYNDKK